MRSASGAVAALRVAGVRRGAALGRHEFPAAGGSRWANSAAVRLLAGQRLSWTSQKARTRTPLSKGRRVSSCSCVACLRRGEVHLGLWTTATAAAKAAQLPGAGASVDEVADLLRQYS